MWRAEGGLFFSSRRRHTRCSRDWSSDVCSSDLLEIELGCGDATFLLNYAKAHPEHNFIGVERSEERRVGKEWRSRWAPLDQKTKDHEGLPSASGDRPDLTRASTAAPRGTHPSQH